MLTSSAAVARDSVCSLASGSSLSNVETLRKAAETGEGGTLNRKKKDKYIYIYIYIYIGRRRNKKLHKKGGDINKRECARCASRRVPCT